MNANQDDIDQEACCNENDGCSCKDNEVANEGHQDEGLKDLLLRAHADIENMRKRMIKDREETIKFANTKFAKDVLPIVDNLDRALSNMSGNEHCKAFVDGIELTKKELYSALAKNGITQIEAKLSDPFDHNVHQIMCEVESDDVESGKIAAVYQAGFMINGRLLRPALVGVAKQK